jgi:peroxiredoxin
MSKKSILNKYFLLVVVILVFLGACDRSTQQSPIAAVGVEDSAPDFTLNDLSGTEISLSDFHGQVVVVNFWATWCPPCRAEMPSMEKLYQTLKDQGLVILAVNIEPNGRQTVADFLARNPHTFPVLLDSQGVVQKRYGVFKFPESFVIRKDGTVDDKVVGAIDWAHPEAVAYFRSLLKG